MIGNKKRAIENCGTKYAMKYNYNKGLIPNNDLEIRQGGLTPSEVYSHIND